MRELLSLRRDEAPIIGEVYRYKNEFLKCVADNCSPVEGCEKCYFDAEYCCGLCDGGYGATSRQHFERVPENELETAADVKFRHIEETKGEPPKKDEIFIASVGLVKLTETTCTRLNDCAACDLTMSECDSCDCLPNHCYKKSPTMRHIRETCREKPPRIGERFRDGVSIVEFRSPDSAGYSSTCNRCWYNDEEDGCLLNIGCCTGYSKNGACPPVFGYYVEIDKE